MSFAFKFSLFLFKKEESQTLLPSFYPINFYLHADWGKQGHFNLTSPIFLQKEDFPWLPSRIIVILNFILH